MAWAMEEQSVEKTEEFCRRGAANWIIRADFPMQILFRDTGEHAGNCGLHRFNWNTRVFEIGWWCRKRYQGKGLITEAAAALTDFAFNHLGARRVWCHADEENERSWRVAERLGFVHEGTLKSERCDPDGTRRTMRVYATTR
jgi:RimJ/RimL family protein N-acetyltransferase